MKNAIVLLLFATALVNAAVVQGTVFDSELKPTKAIVSVNTTPTQTVVAQNGSYSFSIAPGFYELKAKAGNETTTETIRVSQDGTFTIDLILFGFDSPDVDIPNLDDQTGFEDQPTALPDSQSPIPIIPLIGIIAAVALLAIFLALRKPAAAVQPPKAEEKKELPVESAKGLNEFQRQIVSELKKSEGRMNQKELRKLLPWSEAKVSIELDLLEEKGRIKKIKKGRGNVIILVD